MDIAHSLYKAAKPLVYKTNPEQAHELMLFAGELFGATALGRSLLALMYRYRGPDIGKTVDGIKYEIPILLSAGMDPDGRLTTSLRDMSFGGEEVGSTTAYPCVGNPKPRMTRLPKNKSIIVYKGLRNKGVDALIAKLSRTKRVKGYVIGISIALTNYRPESCATIEGAVEDYALSFKKLNEANIGDYYTLNISCPNTQGGVEDMLQVPENFERLLKRINEVKKSLRKPDETQCAGGERAQAYQAYDGASERDPQRSSSRVSAGEKPLYIKMPINLPWDEFDKLVQVADRNGVSGLIIGNLNKNYDDLEVRSEAPEKFRGGLSGKPTRELSNALIRQTRAKYGKRFTLIGVGGILSPDDAMEKFRAGADLIMLISGMIFYSPSLMKHIAQRIAQEKAAGRPV